MAGLRAQRSQRDQVVTIAHKLAARSWVANHDGNITVRLGGGRFLATPTATAKADVCDASLIEVDQTGARVAGTARPFGELPMHLAIFAEREDVGAVIHAHPPYATALACSGSTIIERPFIAEAVVSLGPWIPTLSFAAPGPDSVEALRREAARVDLVLLANHGVFSWGPDLELAYLRMELAEHLARIATLAETTGGAQPLPESVMFALLSARAKARLGAAADRALDFAEKQVVACAPAPHSSTKTMPHTGRPDATQLAAIIKEELTKLLG
jgi:L-fuculose-phosphate aldolase